VIIMLCLDKWYDFGSDWFMEWFMVCSIEVVGLLCCGPVQIYLTSQSKYEEGEATETTKSES